MLYLDASALVKLVVTEKESRALQRFLDRETAPRVSSALALTEVLRACRVASGAAAVERARGVLQAVQLIQLVPAVLDAAGLLEPGTLRSLDAIHLATAARLLPTLTALVTYDKRMADGAERLGFTVVAPA